MPKLPNSTRYEDLPTQALKPRARQARKHTEKQIKQIARSFEQFGYLNPIIVDEDHTILAGHARWEAAKELGLATVPTIQVSSLSEDEKRAYALADNASGNSASGTSRSSRARCNCCSKPISTSTLISSGSTLLTLMDGAITRKRGSRKP